MADPTRALRCAVYTRKSTEEGLDMDFNSLQAQREACEAYIRSQRGEGWKLNSSAFDDGGISGGTMERPALRRLMASIESGLIDVVVVYKVDRLTRSLSDFSKVVEVFDRHSVSFVAVTQQFNTTTSMGRLTLNVLLSFAQFEREVTAERIRDKIAASKKKGLWMGGCVPRGYRVEDKKLIVVPQQAEVINRIFQLYLASGGVRELAMTLRREGIASLAKDSEGTISYSRGALYGILRCPTYVGLVAHKGQRYPGQHDAIVDRAIWDAAQVKLTEGQPGDSKHPELADRHRLKGKLFDRQGRPLTPTHATKRGKRYRYYVSHPDDVASDRLDQQSADGWSLPALDIEAKISACVESVLVDRAAIVERAMAVSMVTSDLTVLLKAIEVADASDRLRWVEQVTLDTDHLQLILNLPGPTSLRIETAIPMRLKRRGVERRILIEPAQQSATAADPILLRTLSLSLRCWDQLNSDTPMTLEAFAKIEGVDKRKVARSLHLAFLAPDVIRSIAEGRLSPEWTTHRLTRLEAIPASWAQQRRMLIAG